MKGIFKNFLVFFFIFLVIATLFTALSDKAVSNENIGINDFISLVKTSKFPTLRLVVIKLILFCYQVIKSLLRKSW